MRQRRRRLIISRSQKAEATESGSLSAGILFIVPLTGKSISVGLRTI